MSLEYDDRAAKKAYRRLLRYEKEGRMLEKRSEEYEVLEEVFDKPTLMALYSLMNSKVFDHLNGVVSAGKESRVYWGVREDGSDIAVKIYLIGAAEFKRRLIYIVGDPRFRRVKRGMRGLVELWARKEFRNLLTAYNASVRVPKPYTVLRNILIIEFIGYKGKPAPILSDTDVNKRDYLQTVSIIRKLYSKARLVHADLSEYNLFKHNDSLVLFDLGAAVDLNHPNAHEFLKRDIFNVNRFFLKRGVDVLPDSEVYRRVTGHEL